MLQKIFQRKQPWFESWWCFHSLQSFLSRHSIFNAFFLSVICTKRRTVGGRDKKGKAHLEFRRFATINLKKLEFRNALLCRCLAYNQAVNAFSSRIINGFLDILPLTWLVQIHICIILLISRYITYLRSKSNSIFRKRSTITRSYM